MTYTVKELASLSSVSVRTLHYYDEIGLLKPAYYGDNGYRYYEKEQLLRLQQILFFRELDVQLADLQSIIESDEFDRIQALRDHRRLLLDKAQRLNTLVRTIDRTISHLKGENGLKDEDMYLGFDQAKQEEYEAEIKTKYGEAALNERKHRTKDWKKENYEQVKADYDRLHKALTFMILRGANPDDDDVQAIVREHYEVISRFYTPTKDIYAGLGEMYVQHPEFRKLYDSYHPQLAEYIRDAMNIFADRHLA
jgi:DNA-binding transcriptional MerR regulator